MIVSTMAKTTTHTTILMNCSRLLNIPTSYGVVLLDHCLPTQHSDPDHLPVLHRAGVDQLVIRMQLSQQAPHGYGRSQRRDHRLSPARSAKELTYTK